MNFRSPRIKSAPAILLAGIRQHHAMADAATSVPGQWRDFRERGVRSAAGRRAYGAYCETTADGFEYMTGVEVDSFDDLAADVDRMRVPAQQYAIFTHDGHVSDLGLVWQHIWRDWLPRSGYEDAGTPPFELYDERFNADTGVGTFEVWFPLREKL